MNYRTSGFIRFTVPRRKVVRETPGNIDEVGFVDGAVGLIDHSSPADVPRGAPLHIRGWAIDLGRRDVPWDIFVEIDGRVVSSQRTLALPRLDVAHAFGSHQLVASGFTAIVPTTHLAVGPHEIRLDAVVGRRGASSARIPNAAQVRILDFYPAVIGPAGHLRNLAAEYAIEAFELGQAGNIFEVRGSAAGDRGAAIEAVAARINYGAWSCGWLETSSTQGRAEATRGAARFCCRIRLDTLAAGSHTVSIAARTRAGAWFALGRPRPLTIAARQPETPARWTRALLDGGRAEITSDGQRIERLEMSRFGPTQSFEGSLERTTPIGTPLVLIARSTDGDEHALPTWSAPTDEPQRVRFGVSVESRALRSGSYRLIVQAPDRTQHYVGRADTGCDLKVTFAVPRAIVPASVELELDG